jgi:hypothetical protein
LFLFFLPRRLYDGRLHDGLLGCDEHRALVAVARGARAALRLRALGAKDGKAAAVAAQHSGGHVALAEEAPLLPPLLLVKTLAVIVEDSRLRIRKPGLVGVDVDTLLLRVAPAAGELLRQVRLLRSPRTRILPLGHVLLATGADALGEEASVLARLRNAPLHAPLSLLALHGVVHDTVVHLLVRRRLCLEARRALLGRLRAQHLHVRVVHLVAPRALVGCGAPGARIGPALTVGLDNVARLDGLVLEGLEGLRGQCHLYCVACVLFAAGGYRPFLPPSDSIFFWN